MATIIHDDTAQKVYEYAHSTFYLNEEITTIYGCMKIYFEQVYINTWKGKYKEIFPDSNTNNDSTTIRKNFLVTVSEGLEFF